MVSYKVLFLGSFFIFAQLGYCALPLLLSSAVGKGTGRGTCLSQHIIDITKSQIRQTITDNVIQDHVMVLDGQKWIY